MMNSERIPRNLFLFGASAGGLKALIGILNQLPAEFPATVGIVLHRSPTFESALDEILSRRASLPVVEPTDGDPIGSGRIYVAPRDFHMLVHGNRWRLSRGPKVHWARPAVDPLFISGAESRGPQVAGVLLSGGGADGVSGLIAIKAAGGVCIAQDPDEAMAPSMPRSAIEEDHIDAIMRTHEIAAVLPTLAAGNPIRASAVRSGGSAGSVRRASSGL